MDIIRKKFVVFAFSDQFNAVLCDLPQAFFVDLSNNRNNKTLVKGHGHSHVDIFKIQNSLIGPFCVYDGVFTNCCGSDLHHDVGNGQPYAKQLLNDWKKRPPPLEDLAGVHCVGHIGLGRFNLTRQHFFGDGLSHSRKRNQPVALADRSFSRNRNSLCPSV